MIKRREIALAIILTIVTCGIYGMYWFVIMETMSTNYLKMKVSFQELSYCC